MKYIYILRDPRDKIIRYVGQTGNPALRLKYHSDPANQTSNEFMIAWKKDLSAAGRVPLLEVIHKCKNKQADEMENKYIQKYMQSHPILNIAVNPVKAKKLKNRKKDPSPPQVEKRKSPVHFEKKKKKEHIKVETLGKVQLISAEPRKKKVKKEKKKLATSVRHFSPNSCFESKNFSTRLITVEITKK